MEYYQKNPMSAASMSGLTIAAYLRSYLKIDIEEKRILSFKG